MKRLFGKHVHKLESNIKKGLKNIWCKWWMDSADSG